MEKVKQQTGAVEIDENGNPMFNWLNGEPCESCGLDQCLPDHIHPAGMVFHTSVGRFLWWQEIEARNRLRQPEKLLIQPTDRKALTKHETGINARLEERRKKTRERNRRYYRRKRQRQVLNPQNSTLRV